MHLCIPLRGHLIENVANKEIKGKWLPIDRGRGRVALLQLATARAQDGEARPWGLTLPRRGPPSQSASVAGLTHAAVLLLGRLGAAWPWRFHLPSRSRATEHSVHL
jgi:hypothetical protein